jgi:hypothetical protein
MRPNMMKVFRGVAERWEDAKSKIGFGYFDHRHVHYQVRNKEGQLSIGPDF